MQIKFLKSVVETLVNKQSSSIIDLLAGKKNVNEFLIAKKLDLTINQTRNILYKLSDYGLVSFIRKKDKRKGWYIYFWTLNVFQSLTLFEDNLKKKDEKLEEQLKNRKENRFYICNTCSIEVTEEVALLNDFTCPECEEIYELADNAEHIKHIEKNISRIKKEIELVSSEIKKEGDKLEKKKANIIKLAEKERKAARKSRSKKKLKKEVKKKKAVKKSVKKTIKKKNVKKPKKEVKKKKAVKKSVNKTIKKTVKKKDVKKPKKVAKKNLKKSSKKKRK